ncbi:hypothetical protein BKA67DRAFT_670888 [Truncatella angustata]|uniref:Thioredoxin reductase n=1 Tax=Truncatella angustata TaxID=152316 RepID=A0A9P8RK14_9PEZI|nr:uncharacterized protein BKA67DRAFT_670888 [Truncatella angustata]KAH6643269.1 hypothetical protein BKA67DRAFT_670888 [Truncatella angustata]
MANPWIPHIASIAQSINSAGVPCILWGHCLLNLHGIPSIIGSIDFVIPDQSLMVSTKQLSQLSYLEPCTDQETCPCSSPEQYTPLPAFHMHLKDSDVTMALYLQSETFWFLPPLNKELVFPTKHKLPEYFLTASDQDLVIVPKSHVLLEAFMRLYARDSGTRIGAFAMPMIGYVEEYVDEDGYLDTDKLPMPLRGQYLKLREGTEPVRRWTRELRHSLGIQEDNSDCD